MAFTSTTGKRDYKLAASRRIREQVKAAGRAARTPCWRCGQAIDYDAPYWLSSGGRRRVNPRAFVAGHIIARVDGGRYEMANLRPECGRCSITSGARTGRARQGPVRWLTTSQQPAAADLW